MSATDRIRMLNDEHDRRAIKFERPKVMLAVRVVGGAKIIKRRDGLNQPLDGF
jgi:hypothetical protein